MRRLKIQRIVWLIFLVCSLLYGDEGMWMPHQMKALNLKAEGLQMNPDDLYREDGSGLMNAVVSLGGGTGAFVSAEGLILTNHHVAFGALQRASSPEKNYMEDGFLAGSREEEVPAPGYIADVLLGYQEVTEEIQQVLKPEMTPLQRFEAIDQAKKNIVARVEREGEDIRAEVVPIFSGLKYYLYKYKRIKDVRIVYAPPRDLGNFGGEVDNWMWPRHTADFAFLRAYVSKDNLGTDYDQGNVPYRPKRYLKLSAAGVQPGDFTFVMGYPGRTYRLYTASELADDLKRMADNIVFYQDIIHFFEQAGSHRKDIEIKYARIVRGLNNAMKNYQGKLEGLEKHRVMQKKKDLEKKLQLNFRNNPAYSQIISRIDSFMVHYSIHRKKYRTISSIVSGYLGPKLLSQAYLIYRTSLERQKPDIEREEGYQERNFQDIQKRIQLAETGYDLLIDRQYFNFYLKRLVENKEEYIPLALKTILEEASEETIENFVNRLYDSTRLADTDYRLSLLEKTPEQLTALQDPLIDLAARLEEELKELRETDRGLSQELADLKKIYINALLEFNHGRLAPDANSTIRFTYGHVQGYSPRDAVFYEPITTLSGLLEKDQGEFPFRVPEKLKELKDQRNYGHYLDPRLQDIPTCFLNTTNVTGGNSGSPTLNARGEQVGIVFDMTYESVIGDYYIIPELQRTINVDIRFVLFLTEKFSGAEHILKEMDIVF